jgi:hypothetical protein
VVEDVGVSVKKAEAVLRDVVLPATEQLARHKRATFKGADGDVPLELLEYEPDGGQNKEDSMSWMKGAKKRKRIDNQTPEMEVEKKRKLEEKKIEKKRKREERKEEKKAEKKRKRQKKALEKKQTQPRSRTMREAASETATEQWKVGGKKKREDASETTTEQWKVGGTMREAITRRQHVLIDFRSGAEKVAADGKIQDLIRLEKLPSEGRPKIAIKAFAYEIRRWLFSYKDFEGLARMSKAPTHLGRRGVEDLLAAGKRFNREVVDEEKWLKYTVLENRSKLRKRGVSVVESDWKKAVKQAAKEQRAQGT